MNSRITAAVASLKRLAWVRILTQCLSGCTAIEAATLATYALHFPRPLATAGFIYLLIVVVASLVFGIWQAVVLSLVADVCLLYFFVPPYMTLAVSSPRDWAALICFQVCSLLVSSLFSPEQRQARDANYQRIQMKTLYELSRGILLFDLHCPPGAQLVRLIRQIFHAEDVAIFDAPLARLDHEGSWSRAERQLAEATYLDGRDRDDRDAHVAQRVIRVGLAPIGAMAIRGDIDPLNATAAASLAAIAFERYSSYTKEALAESEKHAEHLRVAVLDALAHAFKTPLTAIRTASCALLERGTLDEIDAELAAVIDEESVNLNCLATRLLQMAKLEMAKVTLHTEPLIVSRLVKDVVADLSETLKGHPIELSVEEQDQPLQGDRELLKMVLTQYLDNAAKYSPPNTPIDISVRETPSELLLSVHNRGSLVSDEDRERIFERFYRGSEAKGRAPGTGVGLSIVKKAAEAHSGHVWVVSEEDQGTTFFLTMPRLQVESY